MIVYIRKFFYKNSLKCSILKAFSNKTLKFYSFTCIIETKIVKTRIKSFKHGTFNSAFFRKSNVIIIDDMEQNYLKPEMFFYINIFYISFKNNK